MLNYSDFALNITNELLKIKKNDVVSISGEIHNGKGADDPLSELPLIEELAFTIRQKQAFPVLEISTETLKERFFTEIQEESYSVPSDYYKNWIKTIDFFIEINWEIYTGSLSNNTISDNLKQFRITNKKILQYLIRNKKKMLFLNYPSKDLSNNTDVKFDDLLKIYERSVDRDYLNLDNFGESLIETYSSYQNYSLSTKDSQKITLRIQRNTIQNHSGSFKSNKVVSLPTGYLEMTILREQLNGYFQAEKVYYKNNVYNNIQLKFENGIIRYVVFQNEDRGNFDLQNELLNSRTECSLTIGYNDGATKYTNYFYYDRCIKNNISLVFHDRNSDLICISNKNVEIKKLL